MSGVSAVSYYLIDLLFNLLVFILWLRIALRYFRISTLHPMGQLIYHFTDPLVRPIERFIQIKNPALRRYDLIAFAEIILLEVLKYALIGLLLGSALYTRLPHIFLFAFADLIIQVCNLLFLMVLIRVIMSWVNPSWHHPALDIIKLITDPLLRWGNSIVPNISGFDFSPLIILVILKIITLFISANLPYPL